MKVKSLSRAGLLATPWTAAYQAPPTMGFSRQEYWSGVPLPSPSLGQWFLIEEQFVGGCWQRLDTFLVLTTGMGVILANSG